MELHNQATAFSEFVAVIVRSILSSRGTTTNGVGGAYTIIDRCTANPIARLRPIPDTDCFELFYWSSVKGQWTTFGNLGRMKLMLKSAHEIIESDPMFRIPRSR